MQTEHPSSTPLGMVVLAGLLGGFLVLGVGGRLIMRILAFTTPEAPRFTLSGTLQVVLLGTAWGGLTAPLQRPCVAIPARAVRVLVLGFATLIPAAVGFALVGTFTGPIVAPVSFLILGAVAFPLLFLAHGALVDWLATRWRRG